VVGAAVVGAIVVGVAVVGTGVAGVQDSSNQARTWIEEVRGVLDRMGRVLHGFMSGATSGTAGDEPILLSVCVRLRKMRG